MQTNHYITDNQEDAFFRRMIRRNLLLLSIVFCICCVVALVLYFKVLKSQTKVIQYVHLEQKSQQLPGNHLLLQRYIRILKSDKIRAKLVNGYRLMERYGIDTSKPNHLIMLDKVLYDRLKVEEQGNGEVLVSYIDRDINLCTHLLVDLTHHALDQLKTLSSEETLSVCINHKGQNAFKESPKLVSLLFMITTPVMLAVIIFIAIKEKLYINLKNDSE